MCAPAGVTKRPLQAVTLAHGLPAIVHEKLKDSVTLHQFPAQELSLLAYFP
jgi:hypothetical protein